VSSSSYLEIVKKAKPKKKADEAHTARPEPPNKPTTTKTTETTKAANAPARPGEVTPRQKPPNFTPLTVSEALAEIKPLGIGGRQERRTLPPW
jgi:hypothetical protein